MAARRLASTVCLTLLALLPGSGLAEVSSSALSFEIKEGRNLNAFLREGPVAAHLLLRSGTDTRILVAFPAGNSGTGIWFEPGKPAKWTLEKSPQPVSTVDARGRPLHGIIADVHVNVPQLGIRQAILSSVRVLRDFELSGKVPADVLVAPRVDGNALVWQRDRLDGAPGYLLRVEALNGTATPTALRGTKQGLLLRITAMTGEAPLLGLGGADLLNDEARRDERTINVLSFLSYREKFLAGSWRFNTYFGRDTLMSLRLLMPVLAPEAIENGISSVLARLSPDGEVAHEEDIGEFAVLRHRVASGQTKDEPIYDYAMIDDDFMLPVIAQDWLLDDPRGKKRASEFLRMKGSDGIPHGHALVRNFQFVIRQAAPFALDSSPLNLISLKAGRTAGQWRDSDEGLGGGRYPYDVNAVWMPAALRAIDRFVRSGLLTPYLSSEAQRELVTASARHRIWQSKAPPLFTVSLPRDRAVNAVKAYASALGLPSGQAAQSIEQSRVTFHALSLDANGRPIPIMHSDDGFLLLFGHPAPEALRSIVQAAARPFPAGLMTDVGLVVANPVFSDSLSQARLGPTAYHGTVIWSWQQAVFAAGLERQLRRSDLPQDVRTLLRSAQQRLWWGICEANAVRTSELWSWRYVGGRYHVAPFGADSTDEDESNAAQLWSSAFLALTPPKPCDKITAAPH